MKPFEDTLRLNLAAARLASAVYYAKAEAYGNETQLWDALDVSTRHEYVERAAELLKTLDPTPVSVNFVTGLGRKVIGMVLPKDAA